LKKIISFLCGAILIFAIIFTLVNYLKTEETFINSQTVIIDPGHGGMDSGAVGTDGTLEKNINLDISLKLNDIFIQNGYQVYLTRQDDFEGQSWADYHKRADMENRLSIINEFPHIPVISIHQNSFPDESCKGYRVYYSSNNENSESLALGISKSLSELFGEYSSPLCNNDISLILSNSYNPTVLVECGFMSNPQELENLNSNEYRLQIARAIYNGVINY